MNTLKYFLKYIYYYFTAVDKHGIHSPFVFQLYTRVIQTKKFCYNRRKKNNELISRLFTHFEPKIVVEIGSHRLSKKSMTYHQDFKNLKKNLTDFIFIHKSTKENLKNALKYMHNDSVLVINDIHQSKEQWQFLQNHSKVNLSINLFEIGLIFFREQQEEQHFTIRF